MSRVDEIALEVRKLPTDEQLHLASMILAENESETELHPEWEAEIARRIEAVDRGDLGQSRRHGAGLFDPDGRRCGLRHR